MTNPDDFRIQKLMEPKYLGHGVYAKMSCGMIQLTGDAHGNKNIIFLEPMMMLALCRFAVEHPEFEFVKEGIKK